MRRSGVIFGYMELGAVVLTWGIVALVLIIIIICWLVFGRGRRGRV